MKKLLAIFLSILLCISMPVSALAAEANTGIEEKMSIPVYEVSLPDENGQYITYTVNENEEISIPVYQSPENIDGVSTYATVQTATLTIGVYSDGSVFWKFTPTLSTVLLTLGFTGSFSVTDFNGLSHGTYRYILSLWDYVPGPTRGGLTLSGTYAVIGYETVNIFEHVRY